MNKKLIVILLFVIAISIGALVFFSSTRKFELPKEFIPVSTSESNFDQKSGTHTEQFIVDLDMKGAVDYYTNQFKNLGWNIDLAKFLDSKSYVLVGRRDNDVLTITLSSPQAAGKKTLVLIAYK